MKRIKLVVAVAAATAVSAVTAVPAMADDGIGERLENRGERVENFYESHGYDVDIDVDEDDVYYGPLYWGLYGADVDVDDGELEIDLD